MNIIEKIKYINDIENNYPVWKWKINGIHIWPLIRFRIGDELWSDKKLNINSGLKTKKPIPRIIQFKSIICLTINTLLSSKNPDSIIFSRDIGKLSVGDKVYNFYTDPLYEKIIDNDYTAINIQRSKQTECKIDNYIPSILINYPLIQPVFRIIKLFQKKNIKKEKLEQWDRFIEENRNILRYIDTDLEFRIIKELRNILAYKVFYSFLLRLLKPSIAIIHCFYAADSISIVLACKDLGIPIYDNQHGVQGSLHFAYSNWNHIKKVNYEMLPDGYLVWDQNTKLNIDSWSKGEYPCYIIGNLWQQAYKKFDFFKKDLDNLSLKVNGRKCILYTLQRYSPPEWLVQIINEDENIFWYIRTHPTHSGIGDIIREKLLNNNFDIKISSGIPLPAILEKTNLHVTANSSVVIEASNFNIKSIVLDEIGKNYYSDYIKIGLAYACLNKDSFVPTLKELLSKQVMDMNENEKSEIDISTILKKLLS